ncbi:hypothetical protein ACFL3F_04405 [Planctomycetota bacterium]
MADPTQLPAAPQPRYRWVILFILFLATTINDYDRVVYSITLGFLKDTLPIGDKE